MGCTTRTRLPGGREQDPLHRSRHQRRHFCMVPTEPGIPHSRVDPLRLLMPATRSPPGGSRRTSPRTYESGTNQFPPTGFQMPQNFPDQDIQNQGEHYPSPTSPSTYQNPERALSPSTPGQTTPMNQSCQTTPIPSTTRSINEGTAIPSMQEEVTTSGPSSPTETEKSSVHTELLHGNLSRFITFFLLFT